MPKKIQEILILHIETKTIRGTTHKHQMTMIFFLSFLKSSYRDGRNEQKHLMMCQLNLQRK